MARAVATTTGVSSTTVASRLSTAVTTLASRVTRTSSPVAELPACRAVSAADQVNRPSRSARSASSSTTTRNATVGATCWAVATASSQLTAPRRTTRRALGTASRAGGSRGESTAAAASVPPSRTAASSSAHGSDPLPLCSAAEEQVDRDQDAEDDDQDPQRRAGDAGGHLRAEEATDEAGRGAHPHDLPGGRPPDAEDDERHRRGHHRDDALDRVGQLEPAQAQPEDADQDHAQRAAEVAAVDGGQEQRHVEPGGVAGVVAVLTLLEPPGDHRLEGQQDAGEEHQDRDDGVEGLAGRGQQQHRAGRAAEHRHDREADRACALPGVPPAEADPPADVAG